MSGNIRVLFTCQLFQSKQRIQYMNQFIHAISLRVRLYLLEDTLLQHL